MIPTINWGRDFGGLVDYLIDHRDHDVLDIRGVSSIDMSAEEMALVAATSARAKSVVMHCSLSLAIEDGELPTDDWIRLVDGLDWEFCLTDHQRVIVRHRDKSYDHAHIFWCTIHPDTGQTPPKQMFLAKGVKVAGLGDFALTKDQIAALSPDQMVRGSFNRHALYRLQNYCRQAEQALGLRRLRTPREIGADRVLGEPRTPLGGQHHREERTGSPSLLERADDIRRALDEPDWSSTQRKLAAIGVGLRPSVRTSKTNADKIVGLVLYDLADAESRIKASQLDQGGRRYGLQQIEKRREESAQTLDAWWQRASAPSPPLQPSSAPDPSSLREAFQTHRALHRSARLAAARERKRLKQKCARDRKAMTKVLMENRRRQARSLPTSQRRAFYTHFSTHIRQPLLAKMDKALRDALRELRQPRMLSWREFLQQRSTATSRSATTHTRRDNPNMMEVQSPTQSELRARSVEPAPVQADLASEEMVDIATLAALQRKSEARGR